MYSISLRVKDLYPAPEIEVGRWTFDNDVDADLHYFRMEEAIIEKGHDCFNTYNDKLRVALALYDDKGKKIKERHNYISPETFYDRHSSYIITSEGLDAMNRYYRKQRNLKIVLRTIATIGAALICWGILSIKYTGSEYLDKSKMAEKVTWDTERMHYDTDAPTLNLFRDVMADSVEVKQWQGNLNGDTAKCRKIFLQNMKALYGQKCFERNPSRIKFEIKGNSLYMYSHSFADEMAAMFAQQDFYNYITDCDFDTVRAYTHKGGGAKGWRIYTRGDVRYGDMVNTDTIQFPELHISLFEHLFMPTRSMQKVHEHSEKCSKILLEAGKQNKVARENFRREFIKEKTELYKHRKNK